MSYVVNSHEKMLNLASLLTSSGQVKRLLQRWSSVDVLPFRLLGGLLLSVSLDLVFLVLTDPPLLTPIGCDVDSGGNCGVLLFIKSSKTPINGPTTLFSWVDCGTSLAPLPPRVFSLTLPTFIKAWLLWLLVKSSAILTTRRCFFRHQLLNRLWEVVLSLPPARSPPLFSSGGGFISLAQLALATKIQRFLDVRRFITRCWISLLPHESVANGMKIAR